MTPSAPVPVQEIGSAGGTGFWTSLEDETTPELVWPLSVGVYRRMERTDSQAASVMRAVTMPIRRTGWSVDRNGARDVVVQHVAADLGLPVHGADPVPLPRTRDRFSFADHLRQAPRVLVYGHMPFEQVYRIGAEDGLAHLRKLAPRLPSTLTAVNVAADGGLRSIEQRRPSVVLRAGAAGADPWSVEIPVDRLVMYVHEREGGNWLGQSLYRTAYKNWLLKDATLRTWMQAIERNGMGVPLFKDAPGDENRDAGLKLATGIRAGANSGGYLPNGTDLELAGVTGTLMDPEKAVRYHDEAIGRSVLAHFLNLNAQGGSYALAAVQADTFVQSLQAVAQDFADVFTQHVIEDLVDANWGPTEPAPRLVFQEIGSRSDITAEAIRALVDSGVLVPDPSLQRAVREKYGIPTEEDS